MKMLVAFALAALTAAPAFAQSKESQVLAGASAADVTDQIIVKWRESKATVAKSSLTQRSSKLTTTAGVALQHKRTGWGSTEIYKLDRMMAKAEMQSVLDRLNADPDVEYAVPDRRRFAQQLPSDPMVAGQWYLQSTEISATRTDQAWDITTGSSSTIVAVLDTGVRPEHPDLNGKLLPGYDFISEPVVANDGDGGNPADNSDRDADPTDTGDFVSSSDRTGVLANCDIGTSSWHGTRVSSLIGGATNDGVGMAGLGWDTQILPVRVLGKCGGRDSDIVDAMAWAAGLLAIDGVVNPNPAKVINLSLGGDGTCTPNYQNAVNQITAAGVVIVASVGNQAGPVGTPANCDGVLGVSGLRQAGTKVGYSSLGPGADIGAPAGNCVNLAPNNFYTADLPCVFQIMAATDRGLTGPTGFGYTQQVSSTSEGTGPNFGTSFSAPLVSGAVALLHSVNPSLSAQQYSAVITGTATPFPTTSTTTTDICRVPTNVVQGTECICTTATCGAGMLNTAAAVNALAAPFGVIQAPATFNINTSVSIDASASFDTTGGQVATYQWSVVNVTGAMPTIANATSGSTTLQATDTSNFTLRLRVTDANGATDDTDFAMTTIAAVVPPSNNSPIGSGGRGGGGGAFDWWLLLLGLLPLALPGPRKRRPARVRGLARRSSPLSEWQQASASAVRCDRRRRRQNFPE